MDIQVVSAFGGPCWNLDEGFLRVWMAAVHHVSGCSVHSVMETMSKRRPVLFRKRKAWLTKLICFSLLARMAFLPIMARNLSRTVTFCIFVHCNWVKAVWLKFIFKRHLRTLGTKNWGILKGNSVELEDQWNEISCMYLRQLSEECMWHMMKYLFGLNPVA